MYLIFISINANSHSLFDVCRRHLVTKVHHKFCKLFDIDDVFWVI